MKEIRKNTSLESFVNRSLPTVSESKLTYNSERNMFLTTGYTSQMGHTYFQGIQLSNRVAVVYNIGRGGWGNNPYFLNGVIVYCFDGTEKRIIGKWAPTTWSFYSDSLAHVVATDILFDYLKSQMQIQGVRIDDSELRSYAKAQISAAIHNRPLLSA